MVLPGGDKIPMAYRNLRQFINALRAAGELQTISQPVSPVLEISKYTDAESKRPLGGKALFFSKVIGSQFPVATNIFGSPKRICMALGVEKLDDLAQRIRAHVEVNPPSGLRDALSLLNMLFGVSRAVPRAYRGKTPPCQEVVKLGDAVDLSLLPVLHCWPKDAGPFLTLPAVITKSLETGKRNVGMYRMQVFDRQTTGMHWHIHKDGSNYYREYCRAGKRMPVAVAVGCDPAVTYAATAPMPRGLDELLLAGFIRQKPVRLAKCVSIDLEVPAEAEFVLEGYVNPGELRREGPFGDHTGYYSLADDYPVFHVTALTHRRHPIYSATLVGPPPMEDCYLAQATERLFLPLLQMVLPEIRDYWFPWEGVFHNIVIVSIRKEYPGHAQKIMNGLWGQGQMSFCKAIVVVDEAIDPQNPRQVMAELLNRFDITTDVTIAQGVLDVLDHSSPLPYVGHKIGLDLTERHPAESPRLKKTPSPPTEKRLEATDWSAWKSKIEGVIEVKPLLSDIAPNPMSARIFTLRVEKGDTKSGRFFAERLLSLSEPDSAVIFILFDANIDLSNHSLMLWKLFNNVDPGRDLVIAAQRLVIDACKKGAADGHHREWPDELSLA